MEDHPYAFWVVSSGAAVVTFLIFAIGMKIMRRVRRVALSGRDSTPLRSIMTPEAWDTTMASLARGPHTRHTAPVRSRTPLGILRMILRRRPWPERGRGRRDEPVWINKNADMARSRDAWSTQEMSEKKATDTRAVEKAWKESAGWEAGWANKWGKSGGHKSKWAKE